MQVKQQKKVGNQIIMFSTKKDKIACHIGIDKLRIYGIIKLYE